MSNWKVYIWVLAEKVTVPEFIEGRAKGQIRMIDGKIYKQETVDLPSIAKDAHCEIVWTPDKGHSLELKHK
jgi:hypothetical protein